MNIYCEDCGNQYCTCDGIMGVSQGYDNYIKYNNLAPKDMDIRQNVKQLSVAEVKMCVNFLNRLIYREKMAGFKDTNRLCDLLQHVIYLYENYEHWAIISGYFNEETPALDDDDTDFEKAKDDYVNEVYGNGEEVAKTIPDSVFKYIVALEKKCGYGK